MRGAILAETVAALAALALCLHSTAAQANVSSFAVFSSRKQQQQQHQNNHHITNEIATNKPNPIIFIPGDGGSQLEARLNKTKRVHYICNLVSDWYDLWINIKLLTPVALDCLIDNMILFFNGTTHSTQNNEGVQTRVKAFGRLDGIDYLSGHKFPKTDYYETMIATFEKKNRLVRNVDMLGAPFDFRKAPNELDEFFQNLTQLIEQLYQQSGEKRVTLICHSMGCLNSLYLLNRKSQEWKDAHIQRLVSLGAPWDGSFKAINAMLFGDNLGIHLLDKQKLQVIQESFPSLMYLFPKPPTFKEDQVLVTTNNYNFTLKNLDHLFAETRQLDQRQMWHDSQPIAANLTAPNVELWCLYGINVLTPVSTHFLGPVSIGGKHVEIYGNGDGSVNLESLKVCERFRGQQKMPIYTKEFDGIDHISIVRRKDAAEYISSRILPLDLEQKN